MTTFTDWINTLDSFVWGPAMLVLIFVVLFPIIRSLIYSFQSVKPEGGRFRATWVWFDNYRFMGSDPAVRRAEAIEFFASHVDDLRRLGISSLLIFGSVARDEARAYILQRYGDRFLPEKPPVYRTKAKGAQEAHEAIRPTSVANTPDRLKPFLDVRQLKLYTLIWQRAVASQMSHSRYENVLVSVDAATEAKNGFLLEASSSQCVFEGFEKLYREHADEPEAREGEGTLLPELKKGEKLSYAGSEKEQRFTQPPARYTEATLVKALEQKGIGRPSTYAAILSTIQDREYVRLENGRLFPTELGTLVNEQLVKNFPKILDVEFTAMMENQLDRIEEGTLERLATLKPVFGSGDAATLTAGNSTALSDGAATVLLDPIACPDLGPIAEVIGDVEWVVHAASQDLPCLAELGLKHQQQGQKEQSHFRFVGEGQKLHQRECYL